MTAFDFRDIAGLLGDRGETGRCGYGARSSNGSGGGACICLGGRDCNCSYAAYKNYRQSVSNSLKGSSTILPEKVVVIVWVLAGAVTVFVDVDVVVTVDVTGGGVMVFTGVEVTF